MPHSIKFALLASNLSILKEATVLFESLLQNNIEMLTLLLNCCNQNLTSMSKLGLRMLRKNIESRSIPCRKLYNIFSKVIKYFIKFNFL